MASDILMARPSVSVLTNGFTSAEDERLSATTRPASATRAEIAQNSWAYFAVYLWSSAAYPSEPSSSFPSEVKK